MSAKIYLDIIVRMAWETGSRLGLDPSCKRMQGITADNVIKTRLDHSMAGCGEEEAVLRRPPPLSSWLLETLVQLAADLYCDTVGHSNHGLSYPQCATKAGLDCVG